MVLQCSAARRTTSEVIPSINYSLLNRLNLIKSMRCWSTLTHHILEKKENCTPTNIKFLNNYTRIEHIWVPKKVLSSSMSWCFDIVKPSRNWSSWFTQSYGHFFCGTGSVLYGGKKKAGSCNNEEAGPERFQLIPPDQSMHDKNRFGGLNIKANLRYFSGTDIARLMGLPTLRASYLDKGKKIIFRFPSYCTLKQQQ